jgi:hypothetical protein
MLGSIQRPFESACNHKGRLNEDEEEEEEEERDLLFVDSLYVVGSKDPLRVGSVFMQFLSAKTPKTLSRV